MKKSTANQESPPRSVEDQFNKEADAIPGNWSTVTYESIDLRDALTHEIWIEKSATVTIPEAKRKNKDRDTALRYMGIEKDVGPVGFFVTESLDEELKKSGVPGLFRITWKGKKELADGRSFNVFQVDKWDGPQPEWTHKRETLAVPVKAKADVGDDMPDY